MIYFILCNQRLPIIDIMLTSFSENILRKALNDSLIILLSNVFFLMITLYLMDSNINELFIYFNITCYHTLVLI